MNKNKRHGVRLFFRRVQTETVRITVMDLSCIIFIALIVGMWLERYVVSAVRRFLF